MPASYPTPLSGGIAVKLVVLTNYKQWGWEDVFYYNCVKTSLLEAWQDIQLAAQELALAIDPYRGTDCFLQGIRASVLGASPGPMKAFGQSYLYSRLDLNLNNANTVQDIESPWACMLLRMSNSDFTMDRPWMWRGVRAAWSQKQSGTGGFNPPLVTALSDYLTYFRRRILGPSADAGTPARKWTGQFAMKGQVRSGATAPFVDIQDITSTGAPGLFKYVVELADDPAFGVGDHVVIRGARLDCATGVSGIAIIKKREINVPVAGLVTYTTTRKYKCTGSVEVNRYGIMQGLSYGLFPLTFLGFERFVKRDTGRPFFGTAGRRLAR